MATVNGLDIWACTGSQIREAALTVIQELDPFGVSSWRTGCLELSTAHVPHHLLVPEGSRHWVASGMPRSCTHQYGWIVFLGDPSHDSRAPKWFAPILALARSMGCTLINFDRDGEITDLLPNLSMSAVEQLAEVDDG
tara:strand:+ start:344 stop:757 length:414 start_codon:yes stop_codon:yes gene_type:complete